MYEYQDKFRVVIPYLGSQVIDRLAPKEQVSKIIGLEYNQKSVDKANERICPKAKFYQCDLEGENFEEELKRILGENGVDKLDFLNLSMVVLHLNNPTALFRILRKYLRKGGVFVKDIDDGLNLSYPDPHEYIDHSFRIALRDEESGYRMSGRQIFYCLKSAGFSNIKLEKCGLSTAGLDYDGRQALFDIYFEWILVDSVQMAKKHPNSQELKDDAEWIKKNYKDIEDMFLQDNYFFNGGFMIFTAEK